MEMFIKNINYSQKCWLKFEILWSHQFHVTRCQLEYENVRVHKFHSLSKTFQHFGLKISPVPFPRIPTISLFRFEHTWPINFFKFELNWRRKKFRHIFRHFFRQQNGVENRVSIYGQVKIDKNRIRIAINYLKIELRFYFFGRCFG